MPAQLKILAPHEYRVQELTSPAQEPVALDAIKTHLRISDTVQDDELMSLMTTARVLCEAYAGKILIIRTLALFLDNWPQQQALAWWDGVREGANTTNAAALRLPLSPVQSIDAIYLHDAAGGARIVTEEGYQFDPLGARLSFLDAPTGDLRSMNAIEIRVTAGYGDATAVPLVYKQAIRQLTAHLYANRGDGGDVALAKCGAAALLAPFREVSLR